MIITEFLELNNGKTRRILTASEKEHKSIRTIRKDCKTIKTFLYGLNISVYIYLICVI